MVIAYLDIETCPSNEALEANSLDEGPKPSDKVILIYYKEVHRGTEEVLFREWVEGEEAILKRFYALLTKKLSLEKTVTLTGWNIAKFDIPFLTYRLFLHNVDSLENIIESFRRAYWRDLRLCLLPFNKFKFKGLSEKEVAKRFGIEPPKYSNKEVKEFYRKGEYEKIEERARSEARFISELSREMMDIEKMMRAFASLWQAES
jgi:predicted PolB exonuclease-like 3'-5' exonuclease